MKSKTRAGAALAPAIIVALGAAAPALAGPSDPAYRGEPNSVHAVFEYMGTSTWFNSTFETGADSTYDLDPTVPSASDNGLDTTIELPNFIDPLPLKEMRIQLAFDGPTTIDPGFLAVEAFDPETTQAEFFGGDFAGNPDLYWYYFDFVIWPNPDWERITIFGDTGAGVFPGNLLIVEIDTISIPGPGAIAVAGLAGLAAVGRRRR